MRNPQFVGKHGARLGVEKTYKLYIAGKFVRSESGRVTAAARNNGKPAANYSRASRKDFRDAVTVAQNAFGGWSQQSEYLRGQIMYRAAARCILPVGEPSRRPQTHALQASY
jgi:aldehyde dehydrogenase family protein